MAPSYPLSRDSTVNTSPSLNDSNRNTTISQSKSQDISGQTSPHTLQEPPPLNSSTPMHVLVDYIQNYLVEREKNVKGLEEQVQQREKEIQRKELTLQRLSEELTQRENDRKKELDEMRIRLKNAIEERKRELDQRENDERKIRKEAEEKARSSITQALQQWNTDKEKLMLLFEDERTRFEAETMEKQRRWDDEKTQLEQQLDDIQNQIDSLQRENAQLKEETIRQKEQRSRHDLSRSLPQQSDDDLLITEVRNGTVGPFFSQSVEGAPYILSLVPASSLGSTDQSSIPLALTMSPNRPLPSQSLNSTLYYSPSKKERMERPPSPTKQHVSNIPSKVSLSHQRTEQRATTRIPRTSSPPKSMEFTQTFSDQRSTGLSISDSLHTPFPNTRDLPSRQAQTANITRPYSSRQTAQQTPMEGEPRNNVMEQINSLRSRLSKNKK
ncbi:hypothetical protein BLNAU_2238 [Blattamonas nauphoetae]|uniref:Uncharacterized protein n=1 Tax=Blattamonas nauphoetae TaxID=2049346 RepID=A0ABQ9YGB8_9EUKA|nr:hypothetical protein BLNAU_2238 [Blattamonas nauphoetae]